jgi:hypothetical protein
MPEERDIETIIREDERLKRFIRINLELFTNLSRIEYGVIEHLVMKEGKLLWKRQEIKISGE